MWMLSDVQVEDSATIECVGKQSTRKASLVLAVCGPYLMMNSLLMIVQCCLLFQHSSSVYGSGCSLGHTGFSPC